VQSEESKIPENIEGVKNEEIYVETYPFWSGHSKQGIWDFNYGDRIVNINTSKKNFVNFGEIGTVIGFTQNELIVLFDHENLSLTNLYERCRPYRGGTLEPESVINMTRESKVRHHSSKALATNIRKATSKPFIPKQKSNEFN